MEVWNGGIIAFKDSPILGIGPDVYRKMCPDLIEGLENIVCLTHPHNYYIQIAGETGALGLIAGCLMVCSIVLTCFSYRQKNQENIFNATAFVVPLALFFPLQSTGDFFGQWNNLFMWSVLRLHLRLEIFCRGERRNEKRDSGASARVCASLKRLFQWNYIYIAEFFVKHLCMPSRRCSTVCF